MSKKQQQKKKNPPSICGGRPYPCTSISALLDIPSNDRSPPSSEERTIGASGTNDVSTFPTNCNEPSLSSLSNSAAGTQTRALQSSLVFPRTQPAYAPASNKARALLAGLTTSHQVDSNAQQAKTKTTRSARKAAKKANAAYLRNTISMPSLMTSQPRQPAAVTAAGLQTGASIPPLMTIKCQTQPTATAAAGAASILTSASKSHMTVSDTQQTKTNATASLRASALQASPLMPELMYSNTRQTQGKLAKAGRQTSTLMLPLMTCNRQPTASTSAGAHQTSASMHQMTCNRQPTASTSAGAHQTSASMHQMTCNRQPTASTSAGAHQTSASMHQMTCNRQPTASTSAGVHQTSASMHQMTCNRQPTASTSAGVHQTSAPMSPLMGSGPQQAKENATAFDRAAALLASPPIPDRRFKNFYKIQQNDAKLAKTSNLQSSPSMSPPMTSNRQPTASRSAGVAYPTSSGMARRMNINVQLAQTSSGSRSTTSGRAATAASSRPISTTTVEIVEPTRKLRQGDLKRLQTSTKTPHRRSASDVLVQWGMCHPKSNRRNLEIPDRSYENEMNSKLREEHQHFFDPPTMIENTNDLVVRSHSWKRQHRAHAGIHLGASLNSYMALKKKGTSFVKKNGNSFCLACHRHFVHMPNLSDINTYFGYHLNTEEHKWNAALRDFNEHPFAFDTNETRNVTELQCKFCNVRLVPWFRIKSVHNDIQAHYESQEHKNNTSHFGIPVLHFLSKICTMRKLQYLDILSCENCSTDPVHLTSTAHLRNLHDFLEKRLKRKITAKDLGNAKGKRRIFEALSTLKIESTKRKKVVRREEFENPASKPPAPLALLQCPPKSFKEKYGKLESALKKEMTTGFAPGHRINLKAMWNAMLCDERLLQTGRLQPLWALHVQGMPETPGKCAKLYTVFRPFGQIETVKSTVDGWNIVYWSSSATQTAVDAGPHLIEDCQLTVSKYIIEDELSLSVRTVDLLYQPETLLNYMLTSIYVPPKRIGRNSQHPKLIEYMHGLDCRVLPLLLFLKEWLRENNLAILLTYNCAINTLLLWFLAHLPKPVVPLVNHYFHSLYRAETSKGWKSENKDSVLQLLEQFFCVYSEFPFEDLAISLHSKTPIPRSHLENLSLLRPSSLPAALIRRLQDIKVRRFLPCPISIMDPFDCSNLTQHIVPEALAAIQALFRRSSSLLSEQIARVNRINNE